MIKLADIVLKYFPALAPPDTNPRWAAADREDFYLGFANSFQRVCRLNWTTDPQPRALEHWTSECERLWATQGRSVWKNIVDGILVPRAATTRAGQHESEQPGSVAHVRTVSGEPLPSWMRG